MTAPKAYADTQIAAILGGVRSIAMIGASANTSRPSYFVLKYLLAKGYRVIPVNPGLAGQEIGGQKVVAGLADIDGSVDMVDVFRNSEAALAIVRETIALREKLRPRVIWMQLGVRNDIAAAEAEAVGLEVIMNRCPKIEYGRLSGEIGWSGVNSGVLSSKRPLLGPGVQSLLIGKR